MFGQGAVGLKRLKVDHGAITFVAIEPVFRMLQVQLLQQAVELCVGWMRRQNLTD